MSRMCKSLIASVLFLGVGLVGTALPAAAGQGSAPGGCPDGFSSHAVHPSHAHGDHRVVGAQRDANGDGQVCVKHVGKGGRIHVHIDNNASL